MKLIVDKVQRLAKMRAHTATHLLHAALDKVLNWTRQAGSLVDEDYLRFDFTASKPLTQEQIKQIENMVNEWIKKWLKVEKIELPLEEAKKLWAKAFFEEKYWDIVRIVIVKWDEQDVSIEFCGGTHVDYTNEIGAFKILWQEAVASWIRRIIAYTGPKVADYCISLEEQLLIIWEKLKSPLN